jgi:hypothetical protein
MPMPFERQCRILAALHRKAHVNVVGTAKTAQNEPAQYFVKLLEDVKADGLDIRRSDAEAVAFLLPDLRHAEIFRISIVNGKAIRLLPHLVIKAGRFALDSLSLTACGILRVSACGSKQRKKKYQFTHAFGRASL